MQQFLLLFICVRWSGQVIKGMVEREKGTLLFTGATASIRGGAGFSEIGELGTSFNSFGGIRGGGM